MAKQKLFRYDRLATLPRPLVLHLQSTGVPMHHQQGELWVSGTTKAVALDLLSRLLGSPWYADRTGLLRLAQSDVYSEALRAQNLPEPDELLFAQDNTYSPVYSLSPRGFALRGHFRRIPGQYGVAFDVEPSGSQS